MWERLKRIDCQLMGDVYFFLSSSIRRISPLPYLFSLEQFSWRIREWKVKASITEAKLYASSKTDSSNGDSLNFTHPEPFAILQTEDIWGSEFRQRKKKITYNVGQWLWPLREWRHEVKFALCNKLIKKLIYILIIGKQNNIPCWHFSKRDKF